MNHKTFYKSSTGCLCTIALSIQLLSLHLLVEVTHEIDIKRELRRGWNFLKTGFQQTRDEL